MNKTEYWQKLQDPRWQKRRLEVLERGGFTCLCCGATDKKLEVHHAYYISGREPWNYPDAALVCVCSDCHKELKEGSAEKIADWENFVDATEHGLSTARFLTELKGWCNKEDICFLEAVEILWAGFNTGTLTKESIEDLAEKMGRIPAN